MANLAKGVRGQMSLPPRGAWIEIIYAKVDEIADYMSLPPRGAWIEIYLYSNTVYYY